MSALTRLIMSDGSDATVNEDCFVVAECSSGIN